MCCYPGLSTTQTAIFRHQASLFRIEHGVLFDDPLVMAVPAKGLALMALLRGLLFERQDVGHGIAVGGVNGNQA
jgi:hypothetical protein